jgi:hypothetical protein
VGKQAEGGGLVHAAGMVNRGHGYFVKIGMQGQAGWGHGLSRYFDDE